MDLAIHICFFKITWYEGNGRVAGCSDKTLSRATVITELKLVHKRDKASQKIMRINRHLLNRP